MMDKSLAEPQGTLDDYALFISRHFAKQDIVEVSTNFGELSLTVLRAALVDVLFFLRDDGSSKFTQLMDITCVDYPDRADRFTLVYHLLSPIHNRRIRIKIVTDDDLSVASVSDVFPAAIWYEREIWDMFGVAFDNHPDLRRLLTDDEFLGLPLRKDYPCEGRETIAYNSQQQLFYYKEKSLKKTNSSEAVLLSGEKA